MKKFLSILFVLNILLGVSACEEGQTDENIGYGSQNNIHSATREIFAMDTYMTVTAYGENADSAVDEAEKEIHRLDNLLSVGNTDSEVYKINSTGEGSLSEDTKRLMEKSEWIYENTDGAYDITVYPLMKLWGFTGDNQTVPDGEDIKKVISDSGFDKLTYDNSTVRLGESMGIDFGGIAKGYTSDKIMDIFEEYKIKSGIVSLGGNVQCLGNKTDGSMWKCGITDPDNHEDTGSLIGVISVRDKAVITSGGYERFFTDAKSGKTYHHIMNPKTGYPAESGLKSVTIVSSDGALADGLSTACFVMGKEKALNFWKKNSDKFDMIIIDNERNITVTEGIANNFISDYDFDIEKKQYSIPTDT